MRDNNILIKIGNTISGLVLKSPAHRLLSRNTLLITYSDRSTGERLSIPANYLDTEQEILILGQRKKMWWKNLHNGAPVTLTIHKKKIDTWAETIENPDGIMHLVQKHFQSVPAKASIIDQNKSVYLERNRIDLQAVAQQYILLRIKL